MDADKQPSIYHLSSNHAAQTQAIAAALARECRAGDCILLSGDLGSGKTTFARGFIKALSPDAGEITSPTFNLVQTYPAGGTTLWHFDLYRLKHAEEVAETGLDDALQSGIVLVEWPQLMAGRWPHYALDITIGMGSNPEGRTLHFRGGRAAWEKRLEGLK